MNDKDTCLTRIEEPPLKSRLGLSYPPHASILHSPPNDIGNTRVSFYYEVMPAIVVWLAILIRKLQFIARVLEASAGLGGSIASWNV